MKKKSRIAFTIALLLLTLVGIYFGGRKLLFIKIESAIREKVKDLEADGFQITYRSLSADASANQVILEGLEVHRVRTTAGPTNHTLEMSASRIELGGIEFIPLIFKRAFHVHYLLIQKPAIYASENDPLLLKDNNKVGQYLSLEADKLRMEAASLDVIDTVNGLVTAHVQFNLDLRAIRYLGKKANNSAFSVGEADWTNIAMRFPKEFYTLRIPRVRYHRIHKTLQIDSLHLLPDYNKMMFALKSHIQVDRIECRIPSLTLEGVDADSTGPMLIKARRAALSFQLDVYRDTRYPAVNNKIMKLPSALLHEIPFRFQLDTIQMTNSDILYEEFPEQGDHAGTLSFNQLRAVILNFSNVSDKGMVLKTQSLFMNTGDLRADFTFPADPEKGYHVDGTLTNFEMENANRMLIPVARLRIRSGTMEQLRFNFEYNSVQSIGALTMRYSNLKVESLNHHVGNNSRKRLLTMILSTFVIKKEMGKQGHAGLIRFTRDPHRSVFGYWWKSILSGIMSVYKLDKLMENHPRKE